MTWNGRVGVRDDLSRLHAQDRAAATSREIGYSSVTQGEGSLDLLTEDGSVRAALGDQPDGRFGVSIWHGGALRFIPDLIEELAAEDGSLSERISGLGDRMISAEGRLSGHDSALSSHDGRISDLGDRMISVGNRMLTAEGRLDSHNTRIHDNDGRISGLGNRMLDVEGQGRAHDTRINTAQARADNAHADAATAQSRADSAWTRAGTGIADAAAAHSRANAAYSLAADRATQGQINNLSDRIDNLLGRVQSLEAWRASLPNA